MKNIVEIDPNLPSDYSPNTCHICNTDFMPNEIKTKDHSHWGDGRIRGLAHQHCNLNYRATYFMPVIIHNSKNYDAHLILKRLPRQYAKRIEIIPTNIEKFSMFSLDEIRFSDSYMFLDTSIDILTQNLIQAKHDFNIFYSFFKD